MSVRLILGGIASGKSLYAESIITAPHAYYIATARNNPQDKELTQKIKQHQKRRTQHKSQWTVIHARLNLKDALKKCTQKNDPILMDGMDLWCSHLMAEGGDIYYDLKKEVRELIPHFAGRKIVVVSAEVGLGTLPSHDLTRQFRTQLGWLNQELAKIADEVILVVAGYPLVLKPTDARPHRKNEA